jgi:hypothetical protein
VLGINSDQLIKNLHAEEASVKLSAEKYGIHYIIIYPDLPALREFYSFYIKNQIEHNKEIVLFAPFYETTEYVRQTLSEGHAAINVPKYEDEKTLLITDALKQYFQKAEGEGIKNDWSFEKRMAEYAKKQGKNGLSVLADMGAFQYKNKIKELVDYELSLPTKYDTDLKGFCIYNEKDFDRFTEQQKQKLIEHHGTAIKIENDN